MARPYFPKKVKKIPSQKLPGIKNPYTRLLYPIAPDTCLVLTTETEIPMFSHREINGKSVRDINSALALMAIEEIIISKPSLYGFSPWLDISSMPPILRP